jgi:hypothetical protein
LSSPDLVVAPGAETRTQLRIRNTGAVVDQFDLQVLGDAADWATVEPTSISLFPGAEQTVEVVFHPAKVSSIVAGRTTFAVKASSHEDPQGSSVEEGVIEVLSFDDRNAELIPRTSKGKRSAVHDLAIDNRGNASINLAFAGLDPEGSLTYEFEPAQLTVEPGTAQFAKVKVKRAKHFWRGPNKTLPFSVSADEEGHPPLMVDGTMVQLPMLPKWFWKAALAVLALLLLALILWFALVKPEIKSSAQEAVKPIDKRLDAANIPELPAAADGGGGGGGGETPGVTAPTGDTVPSGSGAGGGSAFGDPFDTRLEVKSGSALSASYVVPAGKTFALTDMVLQNPQGDTGRIALGRDGTVLLELSLENFRTHDLHTISPYVFKSGESVTVTVTCTTPGPGASECVDAVSLAGFQK